MTIDEKLNDNPWLFENLLSSRGYDLDSGRILRYFGCYTLVIGTYEVIDGGVQVYIDHNLKDRASLKLTLAFRGLLEENNVPFFENPDKEKVIKRLEDFIYIDYFLRELDKKDIKNILISQKTKES